MEKKKANIIEFEPELDLDIEFESDEILDAVIDKPKDENKIH